MTELKPCPMCGGEAAKKIIQMPHPHGWVGCPRCHLYIQWVHDPADAVKKWNVRCWVR